MNELPKARSRRSKGAAGFTPEQAREAILQNLRKAAGRGTAGFFTTKTPPAKRAALEQALAAMESDGSVLADRTRAKPKFFLREFLAPVSGRLDRAAANEHPGLLAAAKLKALLAASDRPLFACALGNLEAAGRLIRLRHGKSAVFAHAGALRAMLDAARQPESAVLPAAPEDEDVRRRHAELARASGFPAVGIAALQRACSVALPALHHWLRGEHRQGRAAFGFGDWSLADEAERAAAIELDGERYLLVRLLP